MTSFGAANLEHGQHPVVDGAGKPGSSQAPALEALGKSGGLRWADMDDGDMDVVVHAAQLSKALVPPCRINRLTVKNLDTCRGCVVMFALGDALAWVQGQIAQKFAVPPAFQRLTLSKWLLTDTGKRWGSATCLTTARCTSQTQGPCGYAPWSPTAQRLR